MQCRLTGRHTQLGTFDHHPHGYGSFFFSRRTYHDQSFGFAFFFAIFFHPLFATPVSVTSSKNELKNKSLPNHLITVKFI